MGQSGSGKSTLALALAGIIPHSIEGNFRGDIFFNSRSICQDTPAQIGASIGVLFQDPDSQFCTFNVENEIAFTLENLQFSREEIDRRISELLSRFNLSQLRYRSLNSLSGGEKQKVAMCCLLALDPPCLVLDEPTANLDPVSTREILKFIFELKEKYHKTILLIEHMMDDVLPIVDHLIMLDEYGSVACSGAPGEIIRRKMETGNPIPAWFPEILQLSARLKRAGVIDRQFYNLEDATDALSAITTPVDSRKTTGNQDNKKEPQLIIKNLSYSYSDSGFCLNDLNLTIYKGDYLALVGPNGAGKSTLLRCCMGLFNNYSGEIHLEGLPVSRLSRKFLSNKMGLVFQNPEHQFVASVVSDEMAYSLKKKGEKAEIIEAKVEKYLQQFNLKGLENENPFQLSQGQKRRLSVASMLINGQEILFLDEPTFGQDKENIVALMEMMTELNRSGVTIVVITHDMTLVNRYVDRTVVLVEGSIIFDGSVPQLMDDDELMSVAKLTPPPLFQLWKNLNKKSRLPWLSDPEDFESYFLKGDGI